jgi:hypothetical protein
MTSFEILKRKEGTKSTKMAVKLAEVPKNLIGRKLVIRYY